MVTSSFEAQVNGMPRQIHPGTTIRELLASLGLQSEQVAVEVNEEVVTRARHATTPLKPGDRVEIVGFVGGG